MNGNIATNITDASDHILTLNSVTNVRIERFMISEGGILSPEINTNKGSGVRALNADFEFDEVWVLACENDNGGAAAYLYNSTFTWSRSFITKNQTALDGASIYIECNSNSSLPMVMEDLYIGDNSTAQRNGGCLYISTNNTRGYP